MSRRTRRASRPAAASTRAARRSPRARPSGPVWPRGAARRTWPCCPPPGTCGRLLPLRRPGRACLLTDESVAGGRVSNAYDVVVVGGGHNGLVAAAYLARAGLRTVVCEARHVVGGAAVTEQPFGPGLPGHLAVVRRQPAAAVAGARPVAGAPRLPRLPAGPVLRAAPRRALPRAARRPGARGASRSRSSRDTDADAIERWDAWLGDLAGLLAPLLGEIPPKLGSRRPGGRCRPAGPAPAAPGHRHAPRRRGHAAVHDVDRRPARRLLRLRRGQGAALGERGDRHVGRARARRGRRT